MVLIYVLTLAKQDISNPNVTSSKNKDVAGLILVLSKVSHIYVFKFHFNFLIGSPTDDANEEHNKNLVPCFVFPGKKPNYASQFESTVMILESVDVSNEDMCLMGNVRVNFANLQKAASGRKRVSIIAKYTLDNWNTVKEAKGKLPI